MVSVYRVPGMPMKIHCNAVYQRAPVTGCDTKMAVFDIVALQRGD
jgi:hypothetical protein